MLDLEDKIRSIERSKHSLPSLRGEFLSFLNEYKERVREEYQDKVDGYNSYKRQIRRKRKLRKREVERFKEKEAYCKRNHQFREYINEVRKLKAIEQDYQKFTKEANEFGREAHILLKSQSIIDTLYAKTEDSYLFEWYEERKAKKKWTKELRRGIQQIKKYGKSYKPRLYLKPLSMWEI